MGESEREGGFISMPKETINLLKIIEKSIHSPRIDGKPLYPRVNYDGIDITEPWYKKVQTTMSSPALIKAIDITTPNIGIEYFRLGGEHKFDAYPQLPPGVLIDEEKMVKKEHRFSLPENKKTTMPLIKLGDGRVMSVQQLTASVMLEEIKIVGNPFAILSRPYYIPNIEEFYFNELVLLSEDVLAMVGANGLNDIPRLIGIMGQTSGKNMIVQLLAKSNSDDFSIEEFMRRYPRLKAFGFIQGDRNILTKYHLFHQGEFLMNGDDDYNMVSGQRVGKKAVVARQSFQKYLMQSKLPNCLSYSSNKEINVNWKTHGNIYYLDKWFLSDYFERKSTALKELIGKERVSEKAEEKKEEVIDKSSVEHRTPEDALENFEKQRVDEPDPMKDIKPLKPAVVEDQDQYNEERHGAFRDMIAKLLIDAWEDLYGKYVAGLEEINGLVVPSGVITSPAGDEIKHQGILSVKSGGNYVKDFPFANVVYEEFIRAMKRTGIPVVNKPSDDKFRTTPYQYNPKLQKSIVSGAIDRKAYSGGWNVYRKSLAKFVDPLAKKLAIEKEKTGNDDEIYNFISSYIMSIAVINYRPGMGFQLRISCGKPSLSQRFADNLRYCLVEREKSESSSMFMGKAKFSEVFVSESGGSVELTVYLNMKAYQAVPDLLGELLVNLEKGMFKPSVDNIMLGRKLDNSIAFLNLKASGWIVPIIAGSRSGKGVQTLNILANIITLQLCLFYLDDKPDMVVQLWELAKEVGISNPVAVDGLKVRGKTEVDGKDFAAPYVNIFDAAKRLPNADPVISEHLNTMVYLKTLLVIRLAFLYNRSIMGSKYGDLFIVADEIFKLAETTKQIYATVELKLGELKGKEKSPEITKRKEDLNRIISWMENLWSEYNSAGIGEFNLGIHFLSLSQFDAIDRYAGSGTGASFKQFMTTFGMKGFGTARIYGRRQESLTKTQYGLETYSKGTGSSDEDIELIQSYRHFTLTDGDNKLLHHRIYKPLLVLNENDSKEMNARLGKEEKDGAFVATMISAMKKSEVSEAQINVFRDRVFNNEAVANAVGFRGVLQEMGRLTGTSYRENVKASLEKAVKLSQEALEYFGVISEDTGIRTVYEFICSTDIDHLWTYSQIKNSKEKGVALSTVFSTDEDAEYNKTLSRIEKGSAFQSIFEQEPDIDSSYANPKEKVEQSFMGGLNDIGTVMTEEHLNKSTAKEPVDTKYSFGDQYGKEENYIETAFAEEDELLQKMNKEMEEPEETEVDYVDDDSEKELNTDALYEALLNRASVNGDPLGYIAQQLDKGTQTGNISKEQAVALAKQLELVDQGYLTSYQFGNGDLFTGKGEMQIDPSVMVSMDDTPSMKKVGKDIEIDLQKNRSGVKLNKETSINCSKAGRVSLGFFEKMMLRTPYGAEIYVKELWRSILDAVVAQGHRPPLVTRVSLYGGNLFINKKICLLNHILNNHENIRLVDIVYFRELFKRFPRIKELRLDEEMLRAVIAELGEYGMERIFEIGSELQVVYLKTLSGRNRAIKRTSIESGFIPEEAYNASIANEVDLRCKNILENRKIRRGKEKMDLWGQRIATNSDSSEARKYKQRTDRSNIKAVVNKGGAFLGKTVGKFLFGFGKILDFAAGSK